jgi:maltooligosyltrehalose synthase
MNLFDALSQARKSQSNPFNIIGINEQINRLTQLINTCNYSDEYDESYHRNKQAVEKSVRQVLNVFPNFRTDVLQYCTYRSMQMITTVCLEDL